MPPIPTLRAGGLVAADHPEPSLSLWWIASDVLLGTAALLACWIVLIVGRHQRDRAAALDLPVPTTTAGPSRAGLASVAAVGVVAAGVAFAAVGAGADPTTGGVERDAAGEVVAGGTVPVEDVRPGDCFNDATSPTVGWSTVDVIPCSEPHAYELLKRTALSAPSGQGYPGDDAMLVRGGTVCQEPHDAALAEGLARDEDDLLVTHPSEETWRRDEREVLCLVATWGLRS